MTRKVQLNYLAKLVVVAALVWLAVQLPLFAGFSNLLTDTLTIGPDPRSEVVIAAIDDESLQALGAWPWDRSIFAQLVSKLQAARPAALGFDVILTEQRSGDEAFKKALVQVDFPVIFGSKLLDQQELKSFFGTKSGFVNFAPDSDGKIRSAMLASKQHQCAPNLALAVFLAYTRQELALDEKSCQTLELRNATLDLTTPVRFGYSRERFQTISIADILAGKVEPAKLRDKILLVGSTAIDLRAGLNDNFVDVYGRTLPGVEVHANIVGNLLNNTLLNYTPVFWQIVAISLLLAVCLLLHSKLKRSRWETVLIAALSILSLVVGIVAGQLNYIWPTFEFLLLLIAFAILAVVDRYLNKSQENKRLAQLFSRYVNEKLLNQLLANPSSLKLGGESREMTVLFSDIRSFTTLSEGLTSQQLVQLINDYLDAMSSVILEHDGTIDKYIGDAIMAFWNAPLDDFAHATHAVDTALAMQKSLVDFASRYPTYPRLQIGIGINTGEMTVGNVGGKARFDYTVLGDNVNLGSRLEGLTKYYGLTILCTRSTVDCYKGEAKFRLIDEVKVKGKDRAVQIYEPFADDDEIAHDYELGFRHYQAGDFTEAQKCLRRNKNDGPSKAMLKRIAKLGKKPAAWDGVWSFDAK